MTTASETDERSDPRLAVAIEEEVLRVREIFQKQVEQIQPISPILLKEIQSWQILKIWLQNPGLL